MREIGRIDVTDCIARRYGWSVDQINTAPWRVICGAVAAQRKEDNEALERRAEDQINSLKQAAFIGFQLGGGGDKCKSFDEYLIHWGLKRSDKPERTNEEYYAMADEAMRKLKEAGKL